MTLPTPPIWDVETHLIGPGMPAPKLVCMSMADAEGNVSLHEYEESLDIIENRLIKETSGNHHIFYDLGVAAAERPRLLSPIFDAFDKGQIHCTKIRQMMIDNAQGNLKFIWNEETMQYNRQNYQLFRLVQRLLGYDIQKHKEQQEGEAKIWRLRFNELDGIPISEWPTEPNGGPAAYAMGDPKYTRDVWRAQQDLIDPDEIPGYVSEMQSAWALNLMGTWGFRTDPVAVREYKAELTVDFRRTIEQCRRFGFDSETHPPEFESYDGEEFGFRRGEEGEYSKKKRSRDMKKIKAAIEDWHKANPGGKMLITDGGDISTSREQLTNTDHPGLHAVAESVKIEKMLTTYVPALERGTVVPINPNYNPIIETFRTSCSGGMKIDGVPVGMNVQNLPRKGKVRECVVPRIGNIFAFCDYDTLEMRTLAQVCLELFGKSSIAVAANANDGEGIDFHTLFAANIYGISYKEAMRRLAAGDPEITTARQYCKIANYGMAGGMGPHAFTNYAKGYGIIISLAEAKRLHAGFRAQWPEMNDYFNYCGYLCREGDAPHVVFPRSGQVRGRVRYTAVCNGFFQHRAAKGAKRALYLVVKECYVDGGSPLFGCRPWLFAHDEIGMEVPYLAFGPQRSHQAVMRLQELMVQAMKFWCPDVAIGATAAMARRWYKGAKTIIKDGYMVPSKPIKKGKKTEWVADLAA